MSNVTARASHVFSVLTPEQVYDAWVKPELVRQWMGTLLRQKDPAIHVTRIEIDPRLGGKFLFADSREGAEAWGYYKVLNRPDRITFSWFVSSEEEAEDNSLVVLEMTPQAKGCIVMASHEMSAEWAEYVPQTARAWGEMLQAIETTLSLG